MTTRDFIVYGAMTLTAVGLSAVCSGLETGLYSINRVRLAVRASRGDRRAIHIRSEMLQPNRLLITLLMGNTIATYLGSYGIAAILDRLEFEPGQAVALNALVLIPVLFILGETLPKDLFRTHTDRWTYHWAGFLGVMRFVLTWTGLLPLAGAVTAIAARLVAPADNRTDLTAARQRISQLIKEGVGAGVLTEEQTTLVDRALLIRHRTAGSEMVPWRSVATVPLDAPPAGREAIFARQKFTRYPVVDSAGRVVGVISMLDALLSPDKPTSALMREPLLLDSPMTVTEALRAMRSRGPGLAIIQGADHRQPLGIVTIKDLVEPLTGELAAW